MLCPASELPNHSLLTLTKLVLPIPTPSIFIISLLILIKSDPKKDVIPLNWITLSTPNTICERVVVTAVDTTGDCKRLSKVKSAFAFWLVATNLWDVPIPTLVISKVCGIIFNASAAFLANLIVSSSILTTNRSAGKNEVVPIPAKEVDAIPIACVAPTPAWLYSIFSPVTKKWFGIVKVLLVTLTILESLPKAYLSKIGFVLCVRLKDLLMSLSVPKYSPKPLCMDALVNPTESLAVLTFLSEFV